MRKIAADNNYRMFKGAQPNQQVIINEIKSFIESLAKKHGASSDQIKKIMTGVAQGKGELRFRLDPSISAQDDIEIS